MFAQFLNFVLECWEMIIGVLENTELGGFSYMQALIAIGVVSVIVGLVFVKRK